MTAADIVKAMGGKNGRCDCPAKKHPTTRTLTISDGNPTGIRVHCVAGCSPRRHPARASDGCGLGRI